MQIRKTEVCIFTIKFFYVIFRNLNEASDIKALAAVLFIIFT